MGFIGFTGFRRVSAIYGVVVSGFGCLAAYAPSCYAGVDTR